MSKMQPQLIVIMGVSGCGKSTIGNSLADATGIRFYDGDDFHSDANRAKMADGFALDDDDRRPWLQSIVDFSAAQCERGNSLIVACSALKKKYRDQLRELNSPVRFVHLHASFDVIHARLQERSGHYMPDSLLHSQFETLESPTGESGVVEISIEQSVADATRQSIEALGLSTEA